MSNSSLATERYPAHKDNYTDGRSTKISEITIHHMAGVLSAKQCGGIFQNKSRKASSNYGIGKNGEIAVYVDEKDTSWCNSNWASNCRAVTIETSNSQNGGNWPVSDKVLDSLIKLVADIAKRNNMGTLVKGKNLTWHRMYSNTSCPGDYLLSKMDYIVEQANKINNNSSSQNTYPFGATLKKGTSLYKADGSKYPNSCSKDRKVTVQGEKNGKYEVYGETFNPHIVYVDKSAIDKDSTVKFPFEAVIKKGTALYDKNNKKYPNSASKDRKVKVQAEKNGKYEVYGETFNPHVVYVNKSDIK